MSEMPHLNAIGNSFFNGNQWAVVTPHHWNDALPAWAVDVAAILATVAALITLTLVFAQS
ncbi:hypothetical protein Back2_22380 [Nocardioides baekrokdamisoli]|uniref:Uncharacterized protein n=1 Tax=Nocardioides baekrokdamisoli TaxID=1804624 RepID=A0A3G9IW76_9ACTN|nr:hypothetical protein [Nocardioides baekrokdamisoli]BBH17951.1 hypothetical protein Back2_22380 [Nocardioides baekrokdamisoli]